MPRSKRDKLVTLSKTKKHGQERKQELINGIRNCLETHPSVFVFEIKNARSTHLKDVRTRWADTSRFFFGKNKVMQIALGKTVTDEFKPGLFKVAERLNGNCGLMFTTSPIAEVQKFFEEYSVPDFARGGFVALKTITLPEGPLPPQFEHSMEPYLRTKLLMPTELKQGIVKLIREFTVCNEGEALTAEQAKILKLLGEQMSEFTLHLRCLWTPNSFQAFD